MCAIMQVKSLKNAFLKHILQQIHLECVLLCGKKSSVLRALTPAELGSFSFEQLLDEWQSYAPLFYEFLSCAANVHASELKEKCIGLCIAGAVLLRERNIHMSAHCWPDTLSWKCKQNGMSYRGINLALFPGSSNFLLVNNNVWPLNSKTR